jgi:hypothetical protein
MINFPFIGGSYPDQARPFSTERTVNFFPEVDQNYKSQLVLDGFPGHSRWAQAGNGPIRGAVQFKENLIVVSGNAVYKVSPGGSSESVGSIGTSSGLVSMDENGAQAMIVDGQDGWVYDNNALQKILDPVFTDTKADSVTHMDSFFIVNRPGFGSIWVSDSFDGLNWNVLRTANAEFKSDPVVGVYSDRELFLGGTFTTQPYYNSGASPMPFEAIRSGRLVYGVAAKRSWATVGNTSYFLAQDQNGSIFCGRLNGSSVERVSTRAWERIWTSYDYTDAFAFGVHYKGHEWYILTFPQADHGFGRTFLYSISTGLWTEIGVYHPSVGDFGKHPMLTHSFFSGRNLFGDADGWLNEFRDDVYSFNGDTMISLRRCAVVHDKRESLFLNRFTLEVETGVETPQTPDPQVIMKHSKDGGYTFKNTRYKSLAADQTNKRRTGVDFKQLGMAKDWVFEVSISDPVRRRLMGGYLS